MIRRPCGSGPRTLGPRVRAEIHVTETVSGGGFAAVICDIHGCLCPESSEPMDAAALARLAALDARAEEGFGSAEYVSPHAEIVGVLDILQRVAGA